LVFSNYQNPYLNRANGKWNLLGGINEITGLEIQR